jgi:hypothetical protein
MIYKMIHKVTLILGTGTLNKNTQVLYENTVILSFKNKVCSSIKIEWK